MREASIAILAGGASRRMGRDKALLRLDPGGPALIELVAAACRDLSDDLFVIAPPERGYEGLDLRVIADRFPGEGPGGGLITALQEARHAACLLLACDAPFISRPLLRRLIEVADEARPVIPWRPVAGRQARAATLEALHAVYPRALLPELIQAFDAGERQLARLATPRAPKLIPPETIARFDPGFLGFRSINTPDDFEWARARLARAIPSEG